MPRISRLQHPASFIVRPLLILCLLGSTSAIARASDPVAPKYDTQTETKIKGTVEDVTMPPTGHDKEIVHLVMKIGNDTVDVYLCPKSFLDEMGEAFAKGDEIVVTGSKVKQGETDLFLARQADKGQDSLVLRDEKGKPIWAWNAKK